MGYTAAESRRDAGDPWLLLANGAMGPLTPIAFPGALGTAPFGIDDRGRIVGAYATPAPAPGAQRSPMRMPMMMSGR